VSDISLTLTEEEVAEYIEGVGSDQALYLVGQLSQLMAAVAADTNRVLLL
jgi:hypothetical protein